MEAEASVATAMPTAGYYVGWVEVCVCSEKGKREVHYFLKRRDGSMDLVVVGKEKSLRHMSYHYAVKDRGFFMTVLNCYSLLKLRSRREVVDWLNSIVPEMHNHDFVEPVGNYVKSNEKTLKDVTIQKVGQYATEFLWVGSSWTCRKRRRHYPSFTRNGVKVSVHDFVYVLAEEDKRLVAYLDDMYEDSRGNKMVVVRWFHKIDEVGIVLPHKYNDREIFFSLCLQDLSIECIDGLATVLSPEHYEILLKDTLQNRLEAFMCCRQFDNDDIKPFNITQVKGYWDQEIIRYMFSSCSSRQPLFHDYPKVDEIRDVGGRPNKRLRWSRECDIFSFSADKKLVANSDARLLDASVVMQEGVKVSRLPEGLKSASSCFREGLAVGRLQHLTIGSQVEVLSQDSGLRGCWFRATIIKMHKDKVKIRYQDVKDAADESKYLEEWVSAFRLAAIDDIGIRICGRTIVRPTPLARKSSISSIVTVGAIVDAWWHDGWWEGIVVKNESEDRIHVYFPGEKKESIFAYSDLRHSQEWLQDEWKHVKERPELVSVLTGLEMVSDSEVKKVGLHDCEGVVSPMHEDALNSKAEVESDFANANVGDKWKELKLVRDLSKDDLLSRLRWKTSGKRRRSPVRKVHHSVNKVRTNRNHLGMRTSERFYVPSSLKMDMDNCKYVGDSLFTSSVVSSLTSLVMSR